MHDTVHIAGILAVVRPTNHAGAVRALDALPGVDVHHEHRPSGRVIVTLETTTLEEQIEGLRRIQTLDDVAYAELVYHYFDTPAARSSA